MSNAMTDKLDAEIEELERKMAGTPEETEDTKAAEVEADEVDEQDVDSEEVVDQDNFEATDSTAEVQDDEDDEEEDNDDPNQTDKPKRVQWKSKFTELEGRYKKLRSASDGKLFQLRQQLLSQTSVIDRMEDKIEKLQQKLDSVKPDELDVASYFEQEDRDILGDKAIDSVARISKELADRQVAPLREELKARKELDRQAARDKAEYHRQEADRSFKQRLGTIAPDYETIDTDPAFHEYLKGVDLASGYARFDLFKNAQGQGDVGRVAYFFNDYKRQANKHVAMLEKKITPTGQGGKGAPQSSKGTGQVEWVAFSDVERFHNDVTSGNFKGTREQRDALDDKFDRAMAEGRINYRA